MAKRQAARRPDKPGPPAAAAKPARSARLRRLTHAVPLILLGLMILILAIPLYRDLYFLGQRPPVIVFNQYKNPSEDLLIKVRDINTESGEVTLDVRLIVRHLLKREGQPVATREFENLDLWIHAGGVLLIDGTTSPDADSESSRIHVPLTSPSIFKAETFEQAVYQVSGLVVACTPDRSGIWYPFDAYPIQLNLSLTEVKSGTRHDPILSFQMSDPHFITSHPGPNLTYGSGLGRVPLSVFVTAARPLHQRILLVSSLFLSVGIVLWCYVRICYFAVEWSESLEIVALNIAMILAVADLRAMLVPENVRFTALFDFAVVLIWMVSLLTLTLYAINARKYLSLSAGEQS